VSHLGASFFLLDEPVITEGVVDEIADVARPVFCPDRVLSRLVMLSVRKGRGNDGRNRPCASFFLTPPPSYLCSMAKMPVEENDGG